MVGGGGLVQIPALVLTLPGATPVEILATNKVAAVWGTSLAAVLYARRLRPDPRILAGLLAASGTGAAIGAAAAGRLPTEWFAPLVLVLIVPVAVLMLVRPQLGTHQEPRPRRPATVAVAIAALGLGIGAWDGLFGPGTGTLFVVGLVLWVGLPFLPASGLARAANAVTNLVAVVVLTALLVTGGPAAGSVAEVWQLGLLMGAANLAGGWVGARTALSRGSRFVRAVLLVVVGVLAVRLAWDVMGG